MPLHHRRLIRLRGRDYASPGAYYVTICTQDREHLFGHVDGGTMFLNVYGEIVAEGWQWLGTHFAGILMDEWVVMPNHVHGIIVRRGMEVEDPRTPIGHDTHADPNAIDITRIRRGGSRTAPTVSSMMSPAPPPPTDTSRPKPLGGLIGAFKTVTTKRINEVRQTPGARVWQRNSWEHIVRDDVEMNRVRAYVAGNVANWAQDSLNK